jgi:hypothetical protein
MRIDRFLLFVLLLATSYGCSEEQPYEVEKESVSIWEGDTRHVIIETDLTEHNYKLESENQEIATATLDVMGVCIATYKSGSTMIRLIDTDNNKIVCEIYVYVIYFNSSEIINWGIPFEGHPGSPGIIIKAIDLRIPPEKLSYEKKRNHSLVLLIHSIRKPRSSQWKLIREYSKKVHTNGTLPL